MVAPSQTVWSAGAVTVGNGLTVMVNVCGVPGQPAKLGVTVMVAVTGDTVALVAVNAAILPEPLAAKPILGVLFVQLNVAPTVPLKLTAAIGYPAQTVWSAGSVTVGNGLTVMVNVCGVPGQPVKSGVTVMVAICVETTLAALNVAILPVPLAAKPITVLLLVQLNVAPTVPLKLTATIGAPAQTVWSAGSVTVGRDVTVTWCVSDAVHPPVPVTVTV